MKSFKKNILFSLFLSALFVLAACGNDGADKATASEDFTATFDVSLPLGPDPTKTLVYKPLEKN